MALKPQKPQKSDAEEKVEESKAQIEMYRKGLENPIKVNNTKENIAQLKKHGWSTEKPE